jgi:polar amino acid transport system substrate-binding protein
MRHWIMAGLMMCCCMRNADALELLIASSEYPPYVSSEPRHSFLTELYQQIGKEMGVTFAFRFMPWKRGVAALEQREVWATVPYVRTPEREARYLLSDRLYARKAKFFFYERGARTWPAGYAELADLRQFRIGGVMGYWYEQMFRDAGIKLDLAVDDTRSFHKLHANRFDLTLVDENAANYIIHDQFSEPEQGRFQSLDSPVYLSENFMMVMPSALDAALLARFNKALGTIRKNGVYDSIVSRHKLALAN